MEGHDELRYNDSYVKALSYLRIIDEVLASEIPEGKEVEKVERLLEKGEGEGYANKAILHRVGSGLENLSGRLRNAQNKRKAMVVSQFFSYTRKWMEGSIASLDGQLRGFFSDLDNFGDYSRQGVSDLGKSLRQFELDLKDLMEGRLEELKKLYKATKSDEILKYVATIDALAAHSIEQFYSMIDCLEEIISSYG